MASETTDTHSDIAEAPPAARTMLFGFALAIALSVSMAGMCAPLTHQPLWLDELHSLLNSAGERAAFEALPYDTVLPSAPAYEQLTANSTVGSVWRGMRADTHPPLYFVLLNLWRRLVGEDEVALRQLSIACLALAQIPLALVVRRLAGDGAGLLAALLGLWSHADLLAAGQARPYALMILLVNSSWWTLIGLQAIAAQPGRRRLLWTLAVGITTALALLTHYLAALTAISQLLYVTLCFPCGGRRWGWGGLGLAAVLFAVTWGPSLPAQRAAISRQAWLEDAEPGHALRSLVRVADLPIRLLGCEIDRDWTQPRDLPRSALGQALRQVLPGLALQLGLLWLLWRGRQRNWSLPALWYVVVVVALLAVDLLWHRAMLAHLRYASIAAPAAAALVVLAVHTLARRGRRVAIIAGTLVMIACVQLPPRTHPDLVTAAAELEDWLDDDAILVLEASGWPPHWPRRLLGLLSHAVPDYAGPLCMLDGPASEPTSRALAAHRRIVVVSPAVEGIANPAAQTHVPIYQSPYIWQVGWVYVVGIPATAPAENTGK